MSWLHIPRRFRCPSVVVCGKVLVVPESGISRMFPVTNFEFMFRCDSFLKSYKKNNCQPLRTFRNYGRTFPFLQTRNSAFLLLYRYLCFDTRKPFICIALPSCLLCTTHICAVKGTSVRPKSKQPSSWTLLTHPNIKIFFKFFDLKALVFFL